MASEFDESKHPRAKDGKFGSDHSDRATASLKDKAFLGEHRDRLLEQADVAGAKFPREKHGTDEHHAARQAAMHSEAMHVIAERDIEASPHAERLRPVLNDAIDAGHAHAMDRVNEEHAAAEDEAAALKAGHITEPSAKLVDKYEATREAAEKEHQQIKDDLHSSGQEAVSRVAELNALSDEENEIGGDRIDLDDLATSVSATTGKDVDSENPESLEELSAPDEDDAPGDAPDEKEFAEELEVNLGDVPAREDYEDDDEGKAAFEEDATKYAEGHAEMTAQFDEEKRAHELAVKEHAERERAYDAEVERRQAAYEAKAEEAQSALEAHHEREVEALGKLTKLGKEHDKAYEAAEGQLSEIEDDGLINEKAFEDAERKDETDEDDEFMDPAVQAAYDRATEASATRLGHLREKLERRRLDIDSTAENLTESIIATKDAIKRLSKITGRAPAKKPGKTKKSSNRPDGGSAASLRSMARYKLKLTKLDFISLVDRPAQETATIRLIKRAGAEQVQARAIARVVKIGDGDDPLVYCWAFTCTGADGQPYHDLQGDAIAPDAFIKAAEEFMRAGAAVDEMHDGAQTSRVAFAFPMDSEIAAGMFGDAIGKTVKTVGLMVAIRPSREALVKLRAKDYTGVSIAGLGTRELAKGYKPSGKGKPKRRRFGKVAVLTSVEMGHQHTIDLDAPASCWGSSLSTSYQNTEGAETGHAHAWVFDPATGAITIAMDAGHVHTIAVVVPADVLAAALAEEAEPPGDDEHCERPGEPGSGPTVVVVAARAPISPPDGGAPTVKTQEQSMPTEQENQIAALKSENARLERMNTLTDAQRSYHAALKGADAETFLAKSATERSAVLVEIEKANEVVYTSTSDGSVYRKSDDSRLVTMAKRADAHAVEMAVAKAATEQAGFEKRAGVDLSHFAKAVTVRAAIVKAVDSIADEAVRKEAHEAIKGANAAMALLGKAHGANDGSEPTLTDPLAAYNAGLAEFAKSKSIANPLDAQAAFSDTAVGKSLKQAYDATRGYGKHGQA